MAESNFPPQLPFELNHSAEDILAVTHAEIAASRARLNAIVETHVAEYRLENFILPIAEDENIRIVQSSIVQLYQYLSPDKEVRDSSRAAAQLWSEYESELNMRQDLFAGIDTIHRNQYGTAFMLDAEMSHYVNRLHRTYHRNGVHLAEESRSKFQQSKIRIDDLNLQCRTNLQESTEGVWFTQVELTGVPDSYMNGLKRSNEGQFFVGLKLNDLNTILGFASESKTRERLFIAADTQCSENIALFEELIKCRSQIANLVGHESFAEYKIQGRMLDIEKVNALLDNMRRGLIEPLANERAVLMKAKKQHLISLGQNAEAIDDRIYLWDLDFYVRLAKESHCDFGEAAIGEYFPLQSTLRGMLKIFEHLFGIRIRDFNGTAPVWHEGVTIRSVWDEKSGDFLGYIYFDLLERPGKYNSNCNIPFAPGFLHGEKSYPSIVLSTTFASPALLRHRQVVTLFHELGHSIHYMLGQTQFASTWGIGTAHDFVEIPSKMLEHWCWTPSILHSLASHYTSQSEYDRSAYLETHAELPDEKPPLELLERLTASRGINQAHQISSSLHLALFDLTVHGPTPEKYSNFSELYNKLRTECTSLLGPESQGNGFSWGFGQTRFRHIFGAYPAGYYCYILGTVYSRIMFDTRFLKNPLDPAEGFRYRRIVLEKGGSLPELPLLEEFVGGKLDPSLFFETF
ncbi:hypothetical protein N7456_011514 [Penicillium angulare]|uniref:Peptidase M3A/M3B catalytic domain-containing protein n=1 Tax=Penicillium angulare TaxID=116970 RepID=A0A9W9JZX1_9EURO|nr:hypothetical protein N7456_011514 [Penicillium angulare]